MITSEEPQVSERGRYSVCEASRRLGCDRRTLWAWASRIHEVPRINRLTGRSYFSGKQLMKIWKAAN